MTKNDDLQEVIETLEMLNEDTTVPRNIKLKIENIIEVLKADDEISLKINKALNELDEMSDDNNIQPYTRTQLWNIVSMLESI